MHRIWQIHFLLFLPLRFCLLCTDIGSEFFSKVWHKPRGPIRAILWFRLPCHSMEQGPCHTPKTGMAQAPCHSMVQVPFHSSETRAIPVPYPSKKLNSKCYYFQRQNHTRSIPVPYHRTHFSKNWVKNNPFHTFSLHCVRSIVWIKLRAIPLERYGTRLRSIVWNRPFFNGPFYVIE